MIVDRRFPADSGDGRRKRSAFMISRRDAEDADEGLRTELRRTADEWDLEWISRIKLTG
jgi:hypothetical protein